MLAGLLMTCASLVQLMISGPAVAAGSGAPRAAISAPSRTSMLPAPMAAPATYLAATDEAAAKLAAASRERQALRARKALLSSRYDKELAAIDRLKERKASWRRDRLLREALAQSLATARALAAHDRALLAADRAVSQRRRQLIAAIDRELAQPPAIGAALARVLGTASPTGQRRRVLRAWRTAALARLEPAAKKIVLPEVAIDPLADPEELDYQAALLAEAERELERQVRALATRESSYRRMQALRDKRRRAAELGAFDDETPRRGAAGRAVPAAADDRSEGAEGDGAAPPPGSSGDPAGEPGAPQDPSGGDPDVPTNPVPTDAGRPGSPDPVLVLSEVVDDATLEAMRQAERSADPALKARAAARTRQAVQARLETLRATRARVQSRAKTLRQR